MTDPLSEADFLVIGSGSAALSAALRAAEAGLSVTVLEKTKWLGGTSAMSGAGIWIPANHVARAEGVEDSPEEALSYLRASAPDGWQTEEDALWAAFAGAAPRALQFIDRNTPLEFVVTHEPDPFSEYPGGKAYGRQLSVRPLSRRLLGPWAARLRRSTQAHLFSYTEMITMDPYHHPFRVGFRMLPTLVYRWLTGTRGQGNALMTGLIRGCLDLGVRFSIETPARALVQDDTGRVVGVEIEQGGQRRNLRARRGVLLATGGFEWDVDMQERHFPGGVTYLGSPATNTGDGQKMARAAGAALARLDQANVYPCLPTIYHGRQTGLPMTFNTERHAILVNRHGQRFVSENDFNIGERLDERDPDTGEPVHLPVWLVGDRRFFARSLPFRWYARRDKSFVTRAETLRELAEKVGLPPANLEASVERFNGFCRAGTDLDFARGDTIWDRYKAKDPATKLTDVTRPPFYAVKLGRSLLGTKGGARTNENAQVLRPDGSVIPGLYAAGLAMANPIGTRAIGAGTTLGPNLTWGFVAAENLLTQNS